VREDAGRKHPGYRELPPGRVLDGALTQGQVERAVRRLDSSDSSDQAVTS
jgi:hypothetical protein